MSQWIRDAMSRLRCRMMQPWLSYLPPAWLSLGELATLHRSDKGHCWFSRHGYTDVYDALLHGRKYERLTILEIGLRHDPFYESLSRLSPSLCMWRDYFPNARIVGFDINDFTAMAGGRVDVFQGDQGSRDDLAHMRAVVGGFDIIIDDGSHAAWHQRLSLEELLPALRSGGLYVVEDLHAPPTDLEATLPPTPPLTELLRDPGYLRSLGIDPGNVRFEKGGRLVVIRRGA